MTADPPEAVRRVGQVAAHLFLLAGQHPGTTAAESLAAAHRYGLAAERYGYAGVWIAEHHFTSYGACPSAPAFAAHLLGATRHVTVGTAACILSNRHPVALAEEAVLLDELSGGRFALGVARGGPWVDLEVFGTGLDRYTDGFADSVDLLTRWLQGDEYVAGTNRFPFRAVRVVPGPRRHIPVWIAATSISTVELAARRGLPLLLGMHATNTEKAELLERYAQISVSHGHRPAAAPHASAHLAYVADTDTEAKAAVRAALPGLLSGTDEYVRIDGSPSPRPERSRYVDTLLDIHPVGGPAHCRQRLAEAAAVPGVRHLLLMVEAAGGRQTTLDNIARLASQVLDLTPPGPSGWDSTDGRVRRPVPAQ
ncbi:LLM class flavin-dependent oxidoreductase [Plantactinospora solaniradicis]|uniref:LLM class flavin-dependent oxidoreductase n=1 Tax=Plantactinospora solaniradicis TaxID=1723736 RepID=A0ABW1K942_9ACTN